MSVNAQLNSIENLMIDLIDNDESKRLLNFIVQFLCEDRRWVDGNISRVDREDLTNLVKFLNSSVEKEIV